MREFKRKSRVLLIDDNADHLRGIKELITLESSFDVVGATTSANIGINLVKKYRPDLILMAYKQFRKSKNLNWALKLSH